MTARVGMGTTSAPPPLPPPAAAAASPDISGSSSSKLTNAARHQGIVLTREQQQAHEQQAQPPHLPAIASGQSRPHLRATPSAGSEAPSHDSDVDVVALVRRLTAHSVSQNGNDHPPDAVACGHTVGVGTSEQGATANGVGVLSGSLTAGAVGAAATATAGVEGVAQGEVMAQGTTGRSLEIGDVGMNELGVEVGEEVPVAVTAAVGESTDNVVPIVVVDH